MEHRRHILPSSYSTQLSLDDPNDLYSEVRQPLADSAGNAQLHNLDSINLYHDSKGLQTRVERLMYAIPTVPSQPSRPPLGGTLELRRQSTRRRRHMRFSRNPIVDSPQYQAYRARQSRDGNPEDAIWPMVLENAFLDALGKIPVMGRRKFSFRGKPYGRNELIKEYLWIAYLQSLPPGATPDPSMMRTRKQVSSHIQVLKGFLKDHPSYDRLFPEKKDPKNGFEDSFKNDPCLRALSEGRLPTSDYDYFNDSNQLVPTRSPMRPVLFALFMTSAEKGDSNRRDSDDDPYNEGISHRFTNLSAQRHRESLESIPGWRHRFPYVQHLLSTGELNCDIIHMDSSLNLLQSHPPDGSHLNSQTILSMPGRQSDDCEWRLIVTLHKPPELYRNPAVDPPVESDICQVQIISITDVETRIKIPFPAVAWANAFTCLTTLQAQHDDARNLQFGTSLETLTRPARDYVDQISMCQEIQSSDGPNRPFVRRAIIVWTFHEARDGEGNVTNWRYLDPSPPRRVLMSPSPNSSHHLAASMNENFNTWAETPLHLQQPNMLDPFAQGLATPPQTAGLQSPFSNGFSFSVPGFDLPGENLSFVSNTTLDSETTLVDHDTAANIDNFLTNANVSLDSYNHENANWQLPPAENFDTDPAWAYNVPSSTPAVGWDAESKSNAWPDLPDAKQLTAWAEEATLKHDWVDVASSPTKQAVNYIEQSIEEKLLPWIDSHSVNETKNTYSEAGEVRIPDLEPTQDAGEIKEDEWNNPDDEFDYAQLAERLK